ncbi:DNA-binding CsgD family transcriptional regulator [Nocardia sp. GAS34]
MAATSGSARTPDSDTSGSCRRGRDAHTFAGVLYGRQGEVDRIRELLDEADKGWSSSLVLVGDSGVGKSALLDLAASLVGDSWRVLRCCGVESESELPFAGLQMLLIAGLDSLDALPANQADALRCAFGGDSPDLISDRFLIGLGTLSLLAEMSGTGPVLCLIDDAQWLDQASICALVFAARRMRAEGVVLLFAGRAEFATTGLPQLRVTPLAAGAARELVAANAPELEPEKLERVVAEAAGNPLALLELPRMDLDALSVSPLPLPDQLRAGYQHDIVDQPESVRTALLVAAAEETGNLTLVLQVLAGFGMTEEALAAAEQTGMLVVSGQSVAFRHPLLRAAVYNLATSSQRRAVHRRIADLTGEPDRRAWHLAAAATGPDEQAAAALAAAAENARGRTGYAAAAIALERSARLTPDPADRTRRLILAVEAAADAGRTDHALRLIAEVEQSAVGPRAAAQLTAARARIEFERGAVPVAYELLLDAAARVVGDDPDMAVIMLIEAAHAAWTEGDLAGVAAVRTRLSEISSGTAHAALPLVEGPLGLHSPDPAAGVRLIRASVARVRSMPAATPSMRLALALQAILASDVDDARDMLRELTTECRDRAMVGWLPVVGCGLGKAELLIGNLLAAEAISSDALRIAEDIGQHDRIRQARSILSIVAANRGDEDLCRELAAGAVSSVPGGVNSIATAHVGWALALLDLGYGRYEAALDRIEALYRSPNRALGQWVHLLSDGVEAAVRLRAPERAAELAAELRQWSAATDSAWVRAHELRCRAMLDNDGELFAAALALHADLGRWLDHARTGLLYGEWLRRERFKTEARSELRAALATFERLAAEPWAERARSELRAAGENTAGRAASGSVATLTAQEFQVIRLAATGATNREIGAQLFLSPKTVGNHLYRAFPKLGVTNRIELARLDLD